MKSDTKPTSKFEVKTAILVDGAYYRKRAASIAGSKTPAERADELESYCMKHLHDRWEHRRLYRIFIMIAHRLTKVTTYIILSFIAEST